MNEVEKMYRNAGIKKIELDYPDNFEPFYPEFTAEKQLGLIKFLLNKGVWFQFSDDNCTYYYSNLEVTLANMINGIWQDLTEEEHKQIKEILE